MTVHEQAITIGALAEFQQLFAQWTSEKDKSSLSVHIVFSPREPRGMRKY